MKPFKDSAIYKQGEVYKIIGEAFMNPNTTIEDLVAIAEIYGINFNIVLTPGSDQKSEEE